MFDYEKDRIGRDKENTANNAAQEIAGILQRTVNQMNQPGEKACILAGCAVPALAAIAVLFGDKTEDNIMPTPDDILFGAIYTVVSAESHPRGVVCGFSFETVNRAAEMFKQITGGRTFKFNPFVAKALEMLRETTGREVPEHLKKFVGN